MLDITLSDNTSLWELAGEKGVTRFRWVTHPELVQKVCPQCLYYEATEWEADDPSAPEPPLHPLCACTREPVFPAGSVLGQDPDGEPIIADPLPQMKPGEFLNQTIREMKADEMDSLLGPSRGKMIRSGMLNPDELVTRISGIRNVGDLLKSAGLTPDQFSQMTHDQLRRAAALHRERIARQRRRFTRRPRARERTNDALGNPAFFVIP